MLNHLPDQIPVLLITGRSGSGKTTLIEKLVATFAKRGIRVGAIKRTHHIVMIDKEGKDSERFHKAGAEPVILASDTFLGYMSRPSTKPELSELVAMFAGKVDIIVVEGFQRELVPRLVFLGEIESVGEEDDGMTIAYITDKPSVETIYDRPLFSRDNAELIAEYIERKVLR